jgi:hypothetical protein
MNKTGLLLGDVKGKGWHAQAHAQHSAHPCSAQRQTGVCSTGGTAVGEKMFLKMAGINDNMLDDVNFVLHGLIQSPCSILFGTGAIGLIDTWYCSRIKFLYLLRLVTRLNNIATNTEWNEVTMEPLLRSSLCCMYSLWAIALLLPRI